MGNIFNWLIGIIIAAVGYIFYLKGKKGGFGKGFIKPPTIPPLPKAPDIEKIKEEFKNETPEESVDRVNDLLDELFPGD